MAKLELDRLVKRYSGSADPAVRDLSLEVSDGELVCLLGPSGCGKTTALRMIGGFIQPDGGAVRIDGQAVTKAPPERRPTAMVFQRYALWPHMNVWSNVAFGLQLRHLGRKEVAARVARVLELVGLPDLGRRYPSQLSGGQQQRVALARALVLEPRILLLDEPLSNLDAQLRVHMRTELTAIQRRVGITTLFVTHDQEEAMSIADRIAVMHGGVLQQMDSPSQLYACPATPFVATFVGTMNLLSGTVASACSVTCGPLRFELPADSVPVGSSVTLGLRPEDITLSANGDGVPARVQQVVELGHYRRVTVWNEALGELIVFAGKDQPIPAETCTARPGRTLVYAADKLIGATAPLVPAPYPS